eukprot:SAG11_NODE_75_length_18024_cov_5.885356_13_plen_277_part_00
MRKLDAEVTDYHEDDDREQMMFDADQTYGARSPFQTFRNGRGNISLRYGAIIWTQRRAPYMDSKTRPVLKPKPSFCTWPDTQSSYEMRETAEWQGQLMHFETIGKTANYVLSRRGFARIMFFSKTIQLMNSFYVAFYFTHMRMRIWRWEPHFLDVPDIVTRVVANFLVLLPSVLIVAVQMPMAARRFFAFCTRHPRPSLWFSPPWPLSCPHPPPRLGGAGAGAGPGGRAHILFCTALLSRLTSLPFGGSIVQFCVCFVWSLRGLCVWYISPLDAIS